MNQVDARHEIIREWRSLPKEQRQTDEQAALFAMQIKDKYKFSNESADPYQTVKGWLLSYRSLTRGWSENRDLSRYRRLASAAFVESSRCSTGDRIVDGKYSTAKVSSRSCDRRSDFLVSRVISCMSSKEPIFTSFQESSWGI